MGATEPFIRDVGDDDFQREVIDRSSEVPVVAGVLPLVSPP